MLMSGAKALIASSKRIWSLPLPVAPWQIAVAPSFLAYQSENKVARILTNSTWVQDHIYYPVNWRDRWPEYAKAMLYYQKEGKNAHDDAPDATTGVAEQFTRKGGVSVW